MRPVTTNSESRDEDDAQLEQRQGLSVGAACASHRSGDRGGGFVHPINAKCDSVAMHALRRELVEAQARAVELPLHVIPIP